MSCYDRERGTLLLPTSAVSALKAKLREQQNNDHLRTWNAAITFWRSMKSRPRTHEALVEKLDAWIRLQPAPSYGRPAVDYEAVQRVLWNAIYRNDGKPCAPRREDVHPPRVTTKDTVFCAGEEACISFHGREVTWEVAENNHSVERAHATPMAVLFFETLKRINWTRGSGGVIEYDSEYHQDSWSGPSISYRFGPRGDRDYSIRR